MGETALASGAFAGIRVVPDRPRTPCPKTNGDEACADGWHWGYLPKRYGFDRNAATGRCPLRIYHATREELKAELALAGYGEDRDANRDAVHLVLLGDLKTTYPGPGEALKQVKHLIALGAGYGHHLLLHGECGLGKTRIALGLLFWVLWEGQRALWLTSSDLLQLATNQTSYDAVARQAASDTLAKWRRQAVLVFDDLGTRNGIENERIFAVLGELLNRYAGQIVATTNLRGDTAGDAFLRAQDRLMATREVKGARLKAVAVEFSGKSQRRV